MDDPAQKIIQIQFENQIVFWPESIIGPPQIIKEFKQKKEDPPNQTSSSHLNEYQQGYTLKDHKNHDRANESTQQIRVQLSSEDIYEISQKFQSVFLEYCEKCERDFSVEGSNLLKMQRQRVSVKQDTSLLLEFVGMTQILSNLEINELNSNLNFFLNTQRVFSIIIFKLADHIQDQLLFILYFILQKIKQDKITSSSPEQCKQFSFSLASMLIESGRIFQIAFGKQSLQFPNNFQNLIHSWVSMILIIDFESFYESIIEKIGIKNGEAHQLDPFDYNNHNFADFNLSFDMQQPRKRPKFDDDSF